MNTPNSPTRNPANPNLLHPNKFRLTFSRLPDMQFFCQSVIVPGVSMSEVQRNTPFVDTYLPGDKLIYDLLSVTFLIDEEIQSWKNIHDWVRGMTFPTDFQEYRNLANPPRGLVAVPERPQYSQAQLTLLTSANNPRYSFNFVDVFPISLSSIMLSTESSPNEVLTADAVFRFSWYDISKIDS